MGRRRGVFRAIVMTVALLGAVACGDEMLAPDPAVEPLVGTWDAFSVVIVSVVDPDQSIDLSDEAQFSLDIQPSGQYTAILINQGQASTEIGILDVEGSEIVFKQDFPADDRSRAAFFFRGDTLHLEGETDFPFTSPGLGTEALLVLEMTRE